VWSFETPVDRFIVVVIVGCFGEEAAVLLGEVRGFSGEELRCEIACVG
jgi:hypothetical protein